MNTSDTGGAEQLFAKVDFDKAKEVIALKVASEVDGWLTAQTGNLVVDPQTGKSPHEMATLIEKSLDDGTILFSAKGIIETDTKFRVRNPTINITTEGKELKLPAIILEVRADCKAQDFNNGGADALRRLFTLRSGVKDDLLLYNASMLSKHTLKDSSIGKFPKI